MKEGGERKGGGGTRAGRERTRDRHSRRRGPKALARGSGLPHRREQRGGRGSVPKSEAGAEPKVGEKLAPDAELMASPCSRFQINTPRTQLPESEFCKPLAICTLAH